MKKLIVIAISGLSLITACKKPENTGNKETYKAVTRVDTIIYTSPKDVHKMDTLLLIVGVDTSSTLVDTVMFPSQDPPYDPVMKIVKRVPETKGKSRMIF